jgi:hypothetical protein
VQGEHASDEGDHGIFLYNIKIWNW